jgi:nitroimidazol reductase NimA-like FMN-containing flavoprotein (pyridoxamine 5'-phosphate oxidase superfamily)
MLITEITARECQDILDRNGFGRLGCARDNQPYVVPVYFAYQPGRLYGYSTLGKKIEWMRANPKVCVEVDEVASHFVWTSVVLRGRFQELPNTPDFEFERLNAQMLLEKRMLWWQIASAAGQLQGLGETQQPVFYTIHIDSITGHRAVPDPIDSQFSRIAKLQA